ncbi:hypothetical protein C7U60_02345 [Mesorhizobium plurifarium]|uniref:hypothetical protein n=1 Tax=Sinorhizobium arboris TaxID=76745 RepID=UPI0004890E88|nr:hypothetical protein [Sinorhizobium arboris]PST27147.1 hypothetical protein C7U60_02345 [Mesorhizobium plurifarium]
MPTYWLLIGFCAAGALAAGFRLPAIACVILASASLFASVGSLLFNRHGISIAFIGAPAFFLISFFLAGWVLNAIRRTGGSN